MRHTNLDVGTSLGTEEHINGWQACVHESHWVMVGHRPLSVTCGLVGLT